MKLKILLIALGLTTLLMSLSACGSSQDSTVDQAQIDAIYTMAAETASAERAMQEISQPSFTPTLFLAPTYTNVPANALAASPTATVYYQSASTGSTSSSYSCDSAGFVADVTIADGTEMAPGTVFVKTWELENTGTCSWTSDYTLEFYSGEQMEAETSYALDIDEDDTIDPGETLEISVELTAPDDDGTYYGYWVLANEYGSIFGIGGYDSFYVQIVVDSSLDSTATPTSTVTATATGVPTAVDTATTVPTDTPIPTAEESEEAPSEDGDQTPTEGTGNS